MKHSPKALSTFAQNLASKEWRLSNLYYCKDENGREFQFKPNPCQLKLVNEEHPLNLILKARQLGITTFFCIDYLDDCLFNSNITAVLIGDDLEDAKKLLRDKVKYAYERLPAEIKQLRQLLSDSTEIMRFSNGSSYAVTTSARSGTVQRLHITEFGKICRKSPDKAEEIISGSLNTVHTGQKIVIESTAQGAAGGFYDLCQVAIRKQRMKTPLTQMDWKFHFFGWQEDRKYRLKGDLSEVMTQAHKEYFRELQKLGINLDTEQALWYLKKQETQQELMKQEFPSTPEEAFQKAIIGAYYAKELIKAESDGKIGMVSVDNSLPVHTAWDIGLDDFTAIWFFQKKGFDYLLIDYYEWTDEPLPYYLKILKEKNYNYGEHFLPHDINKRAYHDGGDGLTAARNFGFNFTRIERTNDLIGDINNVRMFFPRCWFDAKKCELGLQRLRGYKKKFIESIGAFGDTPAKGVENHCADAFRTMVASKGRLEESSNDYRFDEYEYENYIGNSGRNSVTGY